MIATCVAGVRLGDGKKRIEKNKKQSAIVQRRALRYKENLDAGHTLQYNDIIALRPFQKRGIPPYRIDEIFGRKLARDVSSQNCVKWGDLK